MGFRSPFHTWAVSQRPNAQDVTNHCLREAALSGQANHNLEINEDKSWFPAKLVMAEHFSPRRF